MKYIMFPALLIAVLTASAQNNDPALAALLAEKDTLVLEKKLTALGTGSEKDLEQLSNFYFRSGKPKEYDSTIQLAVSRFPKGHLAAGKAVSKIYGEKDLVKKKELLKSFKKKFPNEDRDQAHAGMIYTMAREKEQFKEAVSYYDQIKGKDERLMSAFHLGANAATLYPRSARPLLKRALDEFVFVESAPVDTVNNWKQSVYYEMKYAYGKILAKAGEESAALPYIRSAVEHARPDDVEKKSGYAQLLISMGNYKEAFPVLDKLVRDGKGNPQLKESLALSYSNVNGGKDGNAYVAAIGKEVSQQILKKYMENKMDKPSPEFVLLDEQGITVSLADFRGKTIILDFWATWCGPCKKSFPAMQRVVNKYKNDANVKFLFIHTWETTKTPLKDAKAYLDANHYSFDLFIDPLDTAVTPATNKSVAMFGIQGIPQKYVIDGKGMIRFGVTGFDDGEDAAVEELSATIEYVKSNS